MTELRNSIVESPSLDRSQLIQKIDGDRLKIATADGGGGGVKVEVGYAGGGAEVVKRKRGRPPKAHANLPSAKKSKEEDEEEDVCFICFDGGSLVLCDRRGCPKAYHPSCIKRDEAFFRSKAKWNCGWHICSICQKAAHHMCYTCTYSLCKGCIRTSDYVCVRGDKGFCTVCMKTIMLIENSGDATAQVDFDDKTSWEYLFKVYWVYLKGKLSLTLGELTQAKNPWKISSMLVSIEPTASHISANGRRSITADLFFANLEANESKRRKTHEQGNEISQESPSTYGPKEWASKELLDFVAHMRNGDASVISQFDVQALLLEYIKRNNLQDPHTKTQIICDLRLMNLFGKPRVGHTEMLKLLEFHFFVKEDPQKDPVNGSTAKQGDIDGKTENIVVIGNKERRIHRKGGKHITHNKLDEYAAIDVHNMNLIYLRRTLMESLVNDEKFNEKVVGSIVQIRISGSDQKDDMYRLVQVVGTTKVDEPYKTGYKSVDIMLEVLNLDKKETVLIDTISNQELTEDDCRRLRESIRCGLVRCFTVGEIQEKAMALQSVLLDDRMETEVLRLNQLRDQASEKGQKKVVRECVKKLKLLKTPEERERWLREIPEVHSDPKMNPDYESDDTEEYFNNEHGEHLKPKFPWLSGTNTITPKKTGDYLDDQPKDSVVAPVDEDSSKSNTGKDVTGLTGSERPQSKVDGNSLAVSICKPETVVGSSKSNTGKEVTGLSGPERPQSKVDCNGSAVTTCKPETVVGSSKSNTIKELTGLSGSVRSQSKVDCNGSSVSIRKPETIVGSSKSNSGKEVTGLSGSERPQSKVDCNGSVSICKPETVVGSSKSNTGKEVTGLSGFERPQSKVDCNGSSVSIRKPETIVGSSKSNSGKEVTGLSGSERPQSKVDCNGSVSICKPETVVGSSKSNTGKEVTGLSGFERPQSKVDCNGSSVSIRKPEIVVGSSKSNSGKEVTGLSGSERPQSKVDCNGSVSICKSETVVGSSKSNTGKEVSGLSGFERPQSKVDYNSSSVSICKPETVVGSSKSNTGKEVAGLSGSERPQSKVDCNGSVSICKLETVVGSSKSNTGKEMTGLSGSERPRSKVDCNGSSVSMCKPETVVGSSKSNTGKEVTGLSGSERPQSKVDCRGSSASICKPEIAVGSSLSSIASESMTPLFLSMMNNRSVDDDRWHYRDQGGNVQGPFSLVQLQKWSTSGYFPADMRIWAGREADSLLLNNVLQEHFHHYDGHWPKNVACNSKVDNQAECVTVCSEIPSSTIPATLYALNNSVNLENVPDDLNCDPPSVVSLTKTYESTEPFGTQNMSGINQLASSVFTVADAALVDSPIPKKENHETEKIQDSGDKEQLKLLIQESGNPPSWSTTLSLVVGGTQLPETGDEWGRYPSTVDHQVATASSTMDQITNFPSWHGLGETIEFSTLAEESVSDLLAEVDAMESRNYVPSPTSRRNSFLEDLFNGSMDDFSPTADQGTRSDGFTSTADIHLSRQSTSLQFSFGLETKPSCAVSIPHTTNSDNLGFKWAEMGSSVLQPPRQDMIDLNYSTRAEADEGELENGSHHDRIEEKSKTHTIVMAETRAGRKSNEKAEAEVAGTKIVPGYLEVEEGEFIQPEAAPPPSPSPSPLPPSLLPPLLPLPLTPPLTMGLDVADSRRVGSGRQSPGTTSTVRVHTHASGSRSGNVGRERHHRRSGGGGDRYNSNSNSPRERGNHVEDSGYGRSSRASWGRQSSFNDGGYPRPPLKGKRVCKFYEIGRCKKGSACNYLHPQDR